MISSYTQETPLLTTLFERVVELFPNNVALECGTIVLTYEELEQQANRLAHYLINQGVRAGAYVGVLLERSLDSYISMLAILKAGAIYVPLETEYPEERINYILSDLSFQTVIVSAQQHRRSQIKFANPLILDQVKSDIAQQPASRPGPVTLDTHPLSYVIYTSGSSGKPKGVEIMHRSICHYVSTASDLYQMTSDDKVYQGFSLAFDASMEEVWMALANGGTAVVCPSKDIRSGVGLVEFLMDNQVTVFSTVPTLLSSLDQLPVPSLRLLILGGEQCPAKLIKDHSRPDLRIVNTYGPTESTVIATCAECSPEKPITIGKPLPGYDIVILDEHLKPVDTGQSGELCIAGIGLAKGYVNRPELTAAKFIAHPYAANERLYRTGDLCALTPEGELQFLGRIDDQVKIRGFRIELHEIESVMTTYPSIRDAVVVVDDPEQNPSLVAYLIVTHPDDFDLQALKAFLLRKLPQAMIPAQYELIEKLPVLANGKVDRKALPKPKTIENQRPYTPPQSKLERTIAAAFATVFGHQPISIDAHFFYDLGGHSLTAAKLVSYLRKTPAFAHLSMQNLYEYPTIQTLADKLSETIASRADSSPKKNHCSGLRYAWCGLAQGLGCLLHYAIEAWKMILVFFCYELFQVNSYVISLQSVGIFLGLCAGLPILSLSLNIGIKWLLLGRIKPGCYPLWGWFYLRWWFVRRLHGFFSAKYLEGTPLLNLYFRLLGAKIGHNCFIGTSAVAAYDLFSLGAHSSIGYDTKLYGYEVSDGWLTIGPITIGEHCYLGSRSVLGHDTVLEDAAKLDHMTLLTPQTTIKTGQFYAGSPGKPTEIPADHITQIAQNQGKPAAIGHPILSGMLHYLALLWVGLVHYSAYIPGIAFMLYIQHRSQSLASGLWTAPLAAILTLVTYYALIYLNKKILVRQVKPGIYSVKSGVYLRQWILTQLLGMDEVGVLADSLYYPWLLRCLGAKLGKRVEMGETPHMIPDLITLHDEAFTASGVSLGWPNIYQGLFQILPVTIGQQAFVGNQSFVPSGTNMGDRSLLGCFTLAPTASKAAEKQAAWLGSPPLFLPRREVLMGFSPSSTTHPSTPVYLSRLGLELLRVIQPTTYNLIAWLTVFSGFSYLIAQTRLMTTLLVLPLIECGTILTLVTTLIAIKWIVQGRLVPTVKPLWDLYIRRIDWVEYSWTYFTSQRLGQLLLGTPLFPMLVRWMGAKIGKRVFLETYKFAEFNLISIGDDCCINADTMLDTHLYEDRLFKTSTIEIQAGSNVGLGSSVLYDTVMEKNSHLGSLSLLMKGEQLPAGSCWHGLPCQPNLSSND